MLLFFLAIDLNIQEAKICFFFLMPEFAGGRLWEDNSTTQQEKFLSLKCL